MLGQAIFNNSMDEELCNLYLFVGSGEENKNYLFSNAYGIF